jgi:hypothetical protein
VAAASLSPKLTIQPRDARLNWRKKVHRETCGVPFCAFVEFTFLSQQFSVCNTWQRKPACGGLALPRIAGFVRPSGAQNPQYVSK